MDAHDYIQAAKGGAIMDRAQEDRTEIIRTAVSRAYSLKGLPVPSGVDYELITTEVERKIAASYPYMTGQELTYITEMGVAGELTKETRPTASAIFGWMSAYIHGEERKDALRSYRRTLQWNNRDRDAASVTPEETAALNRAAEVRGLRTLWAEFKQHGRILDDHLQGYVAMVMDAAIDRNLFDIRPEDWKVAQEDASHIRRERGGWLDRALPTEKSYITKWVMLEMCFGGQLATGRDLVIDA